LLLFLVLQQTNNPDNTKIFSERWRNAMKCHEVITENPVFCLPDDNAGQAARLMRRAHVGSVPVITDERRRELIGIISARDLALKVMGESRDANRTSVYEVMTRAVVACRDDDDVVSAVLAMEEHDINRVPVVNYAGRLVGIIAREDVCVPVPSPPAVVRNLWAA
jgi:CBS domain-containing protein